MNSHSRQVVFNALYEVIYKDAYAEIALDRAVAKRELTSQDHRFVSELVYGIVRRQRTLDALIDQFANKAASKQPPKLRLILQMGFYQLRYLTQVPPSAAVDTSVELAKCNSLSKLSRVVNGMLREYLRQQETVADPLILPEDPIQRVGVLQSFPDWIIELWWDEFGEKTATALAEWFNQPPTIDIRINPLQTTIEAVENAFHQAQIGYSHLPYVPLGLRLAPGVGNIQQLPGFHQGWWSVQDLSAQLVSYLLYPQPGETIIDACGAPGVKTTHMAELMRDEGLIYCCDRAQSRLKKVTHNAQRLQLHAIQTCLGDVRELSQFETSSDRVLVDAPCSGLGTLHRRTDLRWRQTPENLVELAKLQQEILTTAASWVRSKGILVYATCTLNPLENEDVVQAFLANHPHWEVTPPPEMFPTQSLASSANGLKMIPTQHNSDGFFMVKLQRKD